MNVWFMFNNHTFAKIGDGATSRSAMETKARECFAEDGCGSLFARNHLDQEVVHAHGERQSSGRYGCTESTLCEFFNRVEEYANWEARG